jgi:hypothetical protein
MKIDEIEEGDLISETFNNGRGVDWKPLTEENWEKELEDVPLFMSTAPTADKMENNDALQAIHSLVYDGTPEGMQRVQFIINFITAKSLQKLLRISKNKQMKLSGKKTGKIITQPSPIIPRLWGNDVRIYN